MNPAIQKAVSFFLLVLCFSAGTGCIIVIEPERPHPLPLEPTPGEPTDPRACLDFAEVCAEGHERVTLGEDVNGCPIESCEPIDAVRCEDDGDCERPDQVCLPEEGCASDTDCAKTCQTFAPPPPVENLCAEVRCEEGYTCVVEQHVSPITGETTEQAACLPQEEEPLRYCFNDLDCNEHERCAFPGDEGFDENINCMPAEGICIPNLL